MPRLPLTSLSRGDRPALAGMGHGAYIDRMDWTDDGIVLAARPHGETGLVVSLLTRQHGRHAGFVAGGITRKSRATWQIGNEVEVA